MTKITKHKTILCIDTKRSSIFFFELAGVDPRNPKESGHPPIQWEDVRVFLIQQGIVGSVMMSVVVQVYKSTKSTAVYKSKCTHTFRQLQS